MASVGRGSQIKGKNFERRIAKLLTDWWGSTIRRVPNSGGLNIKGDIMTENVDDMKNFPFHFELKCQERWNVSNYFSQAEYDCPKDKKPAVIFSKNNDNVYIMLKLEDFIFFTKGMNKNEAQNVNP